MKRRAQGEGLADEDRMHLALDAEPVDVLARLYVVKTSCVRKLQREPYHVNTGKRWTAEENRLGRRLNPSGNVLSLIKDGGA